MANGLFSKQVLTPDSNTVVYTAPNVIDHVEIILNILNPTAEEATLNVAIYSDPSVENEDYVEKGVKIPINGGVYKDDRLIISPGEKLMVNSNKACVVRVSGFEKIR